MSVVNFNMIQDINQIFKEKDIDCVIHNSGSCISCGLVLENNDEMPVEEILDIINGYLKKEFLKVSYHEGGILVVQSVFN